MEIIECVKASLNEDIKTGDITSNLLLNSTDNVSASIISKDVGVFFGQPIISALQTLYPNLIISTLVQDGDSVSKGSICCELKGNSRDIVMLERTLLNFLQRLSGIASITRQFVTALDDDTIKVLDTRKTTPLLRELEKKAVVAGGGYNHRHGLYDMILVKENHLIRYIKAYGIEQFNSLIRSQKIASPEVLIEVEVNDVSLLRPIDFEPIDIVMFDNMSDHELKESIEIINQVQSKPLKEVSGNVTLDTIHHYRGIDIDRISVGSLTHSVKALDLSLIVK